MFLEVLIVVSIIIVPAPELPAAVLNDYDIAVATTAIGRYVNDLVAPAYSQGRYSVSALARGQHVPQATDHVWIVWLHSNSDQPGAAGYHDANGGSPEAKVFVVDLDAAGMSWTAVATHEIAEMIVNRWVNAAVLGGQGFAWMEACDPVEVFGANHAGIAVSDFVLPAYWRPGSQGPYSQFGHAPGPLTPAANCRQEWFQIAGSSTQRGAAIAAIPGQLPEPSPPPLT